MYINPIYYTKNRGHTRLIMAKGIGYNFEKYNFDIPFKVIINELID